MKKTTTNIYPSIDRHQCVVVYRSSMFILYGAYHRWPQQLEDGVVFAILQKIHGVPSHRVVHGNYKVQHVLLYSSEGNTMWNIYTMNQDTNNSNKQTGKWTAFISRFPSLIDWKYSASVSPQSTLHTTSQHSHTHSCHTRCHLLNYQRLLESYLDMINKVLLSK